MDTPDQYAFYRVPQLPDVPRWTAFVKSLEDPDYPFSNLKPMGPLLPGTPDGGATGGGPNAKGAAWGTLDNKATEVFACPANQWALTFDDGPVLSDQSRAILKENNVLGTFFVVGSNVVNNATHKQQLKDLDADGHVIALHSWTHRQVSLQTTDQVVAEIIFNILAVYNVIGKVPRYFRPPTSAIDDRVRFILKAMGLRPVIWNIESLDANIAVPPAPAQDAPLGIDISGQKLSVDTSFKHVQNSFTQKYDARWNYFPSKNTVAGGRFSYDGFISLEHDISDIEIQVARLVVPFAAKSGYKSVLVNACDQILPNASPYLDDNSVLTQFIKSIKLPLAASDLAAFTGSFPATPAGGASLATGTTSTPATTKSAAGVAVPFVAAAAALALLVL
ncbi:chitin deacetylase [Rhizoclosmatium hyalinum]|nr:chitin deacetylase [Rhizoclosmatium hyalinum]